MEECKEVLTWEQKIKNIESAPEEARLMIAKAYLRDDIPDENVQYEFNTDSPEQLNEDNLSRNVNVYSSINGFVSRVNVNIGKYVNPSDVLFELIT